MQKIFSILLAFALLVSAGGIVLAQDAKPVEFVVDDAETSTDSIAHESASEKESTVAEPVPVDADEPIFLGEDTTSPEKVDSESVPIADEPISMGGDTTPPMNPVDLELVPIGKDAIITGTPVNEGGGITVSSAGKHADVKPIAVGISPIADAAQDAGPHSEMEAVDTLLTGTGKPVSTRVGHCFWIMGPCTPNPSGGDEGGTTDSQGLENEDSGEEVLLAPWQTLWAKKGLAPATTGNTQLTGDAHPASADVQLSNNPPLDAKLIGLADGRTKATIAPTENNPITPPVNPLLGLIGGANAPFLGLLVLLGVGIFLVARNGLKK